MTRLTRNTKMSDADVQAEVKQKLIDYVFDTVDVMGVATFSCPETGRLLEILKELEARGQITMEHDNAMSVGSYIVKRKM